MYNVAIIGAGPAGLTAGLYATRGGLSATIVERITPGGQLAQTDKVENYPGFPDGAEGWQLAYDMQMQALSSTGYIKNLVTAARGKNHVAECRPAGAGKTDFQRVLRIRRPARSRSSR